MALNNQFTQILKYFPELYYWIDSSIKMSSLQKKNLVFINIKATETFGSKTLLARLKYHLNIDNNLYYDFMFQDV
ncbi:MAG: hypothetical protein ACFFFB_19410 [Candidatus Heimdallarchaeota archaeon]